MGRPVTSMLDRKYRKVLLYAVVPILLIAALVFSPSKLEGSYSSPIECLCDSTHYIYIKNGHLAAIATGHKNGEYLGQYNKIGIWKYDWDLLLNSPKDPFKIHGAIYSFYLFSVWKSEQHRWEFHFKYFNNAIIDNHVKSAAIEKQTWDNDGKRRPVILNNEFVPVE